MAFYPASYIILAFLVIVKRFIAVYVLNNM